MLLPTWCTELKQGFPGRKYMQEHFIAVYYVPASPSVQ